MRWSAFEERCVLIKDYIIQTIDASTPKIAHKTMKPVGQLVLMRRTQ
jgi:hypothetical protein